MKVGLQSFKYRSFLKVLKNNQQKKLLNSFLKKLGKVHLSRKERKFSHCSTKAQQADLPRFGIYISVHHGGNSVHYSLCKNQGAEKQG